MSDADDLTFRACHPDELPARFLLAAMAEELTLIFGADGPPGTPLDSSELAPPRGTYVVAWVGAEAVGGAGLREIGHQLGEIKRMYVVPEWRGRKVARRLLSAVEDAARTLGYARVRLDTGAKQLDARHLYETSGYVAIADYNGNRRAAYWGEKDLTTPSAR